MTTRSVIESTWAEDMGQFLYHLDSDTVKTTRTLEKMKLKIINEECSSYLTKLAWTHTHTYIYIYIYIYIYMHTINALDVQA